jgi:PAS domain S-box-containing protein
MIDIQELKELTKQFRVLLVEDEDSAREEMKSILGRFFKDVVIAIDGEDGLKKFKKEKIDLIVTDINMPRMNGLEMAEKIKSIAPDINILVISAHNETNFFIEAIKLGIDGFILKPVDVKNLVQVLYKIAKNLLVKKEAKEYEKLLVQYQNIVDKNEIVVKFDLNKKIIYVNKEFIKTLGYEKEEILNKTLKDIIHFSDENYQKIDLIWEDIIKNKKSFTEIIKCVTNDQQIVYLKMLISPIVDDENNIIEVISLCHNVSEMMKPRKLLYDFLERAQEPLIALVEIENYYNLVSFFGEKIAQNIELKFEEYLNYLVGDIFDHIFNLENGLYALVVDLQKKDISYQKYIVELIKIQKKVNYLPIKIDDFDYDITIIMSVSRGYYALENARIGLNKIKDSNDSFIIADGMLLEERRKAQENLKLLHILKNSIENKNVVCFYQPIVDNKTKKVSKFETLVRIEYNNEIIPPAKFLEIAKQSVYYSKITEIVLTEAFNIINRLKTQNISINISEIDIERESIRELIYDLIIKNKEYADCLTFELLEDANIEKYEVLSDFIKKVKKLGVSIAIDDFGSGYSNFIRLINYKPDFLKIDGSLIKNIHNDKYSYSVVKAIVELAKENNIKTIAEFVENEEIFNVVKELGIDYSQGYYFGKPSKFEEIDEFKNI